VAFLDRAQQGQVASGSDSLLANLWSALGVDPDTLPDHVTLGELGMESMFAVEIQQTIEQEYGIRLTLNEIKLITVGELKDTNKAKLKLALGEIQEFKKYLMSLKLSISRKMTEPLNSVTEGEPIFMLPSVLGIFGAMRTFAEKIHFPVIALHLTPEVNRSEADIKFAAKHYTDLLKRLYPNVKRFNLVGLDYGAMVAMKMARKGLPVRVALIDLNQTMKKNINLKDEKLHNHVIEFIVKIMITGAFGDSLASSETTKDMILKTVNREATLEGKVKAISQELHRIMGDASVKVEDLEEIVSGAIRRGQAMFEYDADMTQRKDKLTTRFIGKLAKAKGRLLVIKDSNSTGILANYLLNDINKKLDSDSPIKFSNVTLSLDSAAKSLNSFFGNDFAESKVL